MILEKQREINKIIMNHIESEMKKYKRIDAVTTGKIANRLYKYLPVDDLEFLYVCKGLLASKKHKYFSIGTLWLKKRKTVINMTNMDFFENIVLNHIDGWAQVDQFCYRVMNPMIELENDNYQYLVKWSNSSNKDVRRVSLVSMIRSSGKLTLEYDYNKMIDLVDKLKNDEDFHVRKAVGWVLKCAFVTYPKEVEKYLRTNIGNLDRMIYRYALENVSKVKKTEMMNIEQDS